ncbi:MAG: OmpA family protein [Myxococcota bacterium]
MTHRLLAIATVAASLLAATELRAQADTLDSTDPTVDINIFHPTPGARNFFSTESGNVNTHLGVSAGLNINFSNTPLNVRVVSGDSEADVGAVVPYRVDAVALAAIGLFDIGELGLAFPLVLQGSADDSVPGELPGLFQTDVPGFAGGDLRIVPKVRVYQGEDDIFSAAIVPTVIVPTGGADYAQENGPVIAPALALSSTNGPLRVGLNLGYRLRDKTRTATLIVDDEYFAKLAGGFDLSGGEGGFELIGEVYGHTPVANPFAINSEGVKKDIQDARTTLEGLVGVKFALPGYILISGGLGGGLLSGYGASSPRVFAQAMYYTGEFGAVDTDKDGVPDTFDQCREDPEDRDEFEDSDGCPDEDNDNDGVLDEDDGCPNEAEDVDGFADSDGCPEPDNDEDGLLDADDQCAVDAEDKDGFEDDDGCPDLDNDGDGIADTSDKCPDEKEDKDGYIDFDGCPEPDNDGDGLNDLNDLCPNHAEDMDGVADDDGCPDDNDGDGIADADDKCPNKAETYNGIDDQDGCPEKLKTKSLVQVTEAKIEIKDKVFFSTGSSNIQSRSNTLLDQVASVLTSYKHITKVEVQGHTDSRGSKRRNTRLSQKRAEAVVAYLVSKGVAAERLVAKGYGPEQPISSNKTRRGREQNRRVEFVILEQKPVGKDVSDDQPEPPPMPEPPSDDGIDIELDMGGDEPAAPPPPPEPGMEDIEIDIGGEDAPAKPGDKKPGDSKEKPAEDEPDVEFEF